MRRFRSEVWALYTTLGLLASACSALVLIKHAFHVGFIGPFRLIVEEYEIWVHAFFGWWAEPLLQKLLLYLRSWLDVDLHLTPDWQHVFLIMLLYFAAGARADSYRGRQATMIFAWIWGGLVALTASVAFAALPPLNSTAHTLLVGIPMVGLALYELGRRFWAATFLRALNVSWLESFKTGVSAFVVPVAMIAIITLLLSLMLLQFGIVDGAPSFALIMLLIFVIGISITWLSRGMMRVLYDRNPGEGRFERFVRSGSGRISFYIFTVVAGVTMFLLANAGTKILGEL
jgi:hypothetical protein